MFSTWNHKVCLAKPAAAYPGDIPMVGSLLPMVIVIL